MDDINMIRTGLNELWKIYSAALLDPEPPVWDRILQDISGIVEKYKQHDVICDTSVAFTNDLIRKKQKEPETEIPSAVSRVKARLAGTDPGKRGYVYGSRM